jgi:eukaryotic translation initiation factor 2-alpha kinase 4
LEILRALWAHDISAELASDARSPEELPQRDYCWLVIIKPDNMLKVKTLIRKDAPDADIQANQLISWLRAEFRERDARSQAKGRAILSPVDAPALGTTGATNEQREQQVRVLVAQTKSKKVNRQNVVEQAQVSASKLVQSFLDGPIAAIETTDQVMDLIRDTALSEPESWRKVEHTVGTSEKKVRIVSIRLGHFTGTILTTLQYVREIQDMLSAWRSEYQNAALGRHAFVYNFRTGTCIYYDLGA